MKFNLRDLLRFAVTGVMLLLVSMPVYAVSDRSGRHQEIEDKLKYYVVPIMIKIDGRDFFTACTGVLVGSKTVVSSKSCLSAYEGKGISVMLYTERTSDSYKFAKGSAFSKENLTDDIINDRVQPLVGARAEKILAKKINMEDYNVPYVADTPDGTRTIGDRTVITYSDVILLELATVPKIVSRGQLAEFPDVVNYNDPKYMGILRPDLGSNYDPGWMFHFAGFGFNNPKYAFLSSQATYQIAREISGIPEIPSELRLIFCGNFTDSMINRLYAEEVRRGQLSSQQLSYIQTTSVHQLMFFAPQSMLDIVLPEEGMLEINNRSYIGDRGAPLFLTHIGDSRVILLGIGAGSVDVQRDVQTIHPANRVQAFSRHIAEWINDTKQ